MTDRHILNRRDALASGLAGLGMLASSGGLPGARMAAAPAPSPGRSHPYVDDVGWANVRGFGATGNGVDDDAGPIQRAINSGASLVYFPAGVYRLDSTLDLTDRDDNPITLAGAGTTQTGGQQATTFLGNTGGIVIDTVGSQYVTLRGFRVLSEATSTTRNPSTVGILMGRSRTNRFAQFHRYEDIMIFLLRRPQASKRGTIGIYNVASEHWYAVQVRCIADLPFAFAATDVLGIPSPHAGPLSGPASMTICDLNQTTAGAFTHAAYEFWNAANIHLNHVYTNRLPGNESLHPLRFNTSDIASIAFSGQIEQWPAVAEFRDSASGMVVDCVAVGSRAPYIHLARGVALDSSTIRVKQIHGTMQSVIDAGGSCSVNGSHISLFPGQRIDAPELELKGTMVQSHRMGGPIRVARNSSYLHLGDGGLMTAP